VTSYEDFLKQKRDYGSESGFEPLFMPNFLFDFQEHLVDWAVRKGRAAIFADCGMGKTPMQLVWAQNVVQKTNQPVLILTPLAVSHQTLEEAEKFSIEARRAVPEPDQAMIYVVNYEKLHYFESQNYAGVVCDESSILKNFGGKRRAEITEFMRVVPYRLLCTATAAPNNWTELGTSSEALGYLGYRDMLTKFFTTKMKAIGARDERFRRDKFRLKGHAAKGPFWRWVASWARACRSPSDLGFDDDGFVLPPMRERETLVKATKPAPGMLFDIPAAATEKVRQNGGISMVWCHLNDESDMLDELIPNSVQVTGSDSDDKKEEAARWFARGEDAERVLISKPTIFGFGLNFQHCNHMTYFPTHSYEQFYQATRRLWRFGQDRPVLVDLVYTDGGKRMLENLNRKAKMADRMFDDLVRFMSKELRVEETYHRQRIEVPQWMQGK